ncbi:MAG: thiamine pyrophosphate-dependent dehydrogenase E1 component subunit alpha [Planctomycetota bacterium]|nr:thiamine pyrophosphate-dependent dehydrogenase E1 component subunit alpha [Planctomycetota bacterium]
MNLTTPELLDAYRVMRTIRDFEERVHDEFAAGEIPGFVHLYAGEEACAAGVCAHLTPRDYIASTHRGHGHCIAKGVDVHGMMAELFGRETGLCGGKGGSMHVADLELGMMGANGIVGGGPPLVTGAALTAKRAGQGEVAVAFVGDGGSNQGTTFESLNLAKVWNLPAVFVVEDNGYAEATSSKWSIGAENNAVRARGFGLPAERVDGHDFFAVHEAAGKAIQRAREGGGPTLLDCQLNRYYGHFEGDAQTYRGPAEVQTLRSDQDCLIRFAQRVQESGEVTSDQLETIDQEVAQLVAEAVQAAKQADKPASEELYTDVYVSY